MCQRALFSIYTSPPKINNRKVEQQQKKFPKELNSQFEEDTDKNMFNISIIEGSNTTTVVPEMLSGKTQRSKLFSS